MLSEWNMDKQTKLVEVSGAEFTLRDQLEAAKRRVTAPQRQVAHERTAHKKLSRKYFQSKADSQIRVIIVKEPLSEINAHIKRLEGEFAAKFKKTTTVAGRALRDKSVSASLVGKRMKNLSKRWNQR